MYVFLSPGGSTAAAAGAKGSNSQLCVNAVSIVELNIDKDCKSNDM